MPPVEAGDDVVEVVDGWLNGMPGAALSPEPLLLAPAPMEAPLPSSMFAETRESPPAPFWEANVTTAIGPLPENVLVLMTAILMVPLVAVLAAIIAPEISPPWLTEGVARDELS